MRFTFALVVFVLSGCAHDYSFVQQPNGFACVQVIWTDQVRPMGTIGNGVDLQKIWARKPKAFDDYDAVCTLGHEFLHSLGATHK